MPSPAERAVEISLARTGRKQLDHLRHQYRNMRVHSSMTGSVTLPVIVETFYRIFKRGVVFEESVHTDDLENIAQERAHASELEIAIQVPQKLQALQQHTDAEVINMIHRFKVQHYFDPFFFDQRTDRVLDPNHLTKINITGEVDH